MGDNIVENSDSEVFQLSEFFVTLSDNFVKEKFGLNLGYLVQAGIDLVQKRYIAIENLQKGIISMYKRSNVFLKSDIDNSTLQYLTLRWIQNNCFNFYTKEKCDLKLDKNLELPVSLLDLIPVLLLLSVCIMTGITVFASECVELKLGIL